jgi:hypothetical protein
VLLGLALWTEAATTIGHLTMDAGQWMKTLDIEAVEIPEGVAGPVAPEYTAQPEAEGQHVGEGAEPLPGTGSGPAT